MQPFVIDPTTTTVSLPRGRGAVLEIVVRNVTDAPIRATWALQSADSAHQGWWRIRGAPRRLPVGGARKVRVRIRVPRRASRAEVDWHLTVQDTADPDGYGHSLPITVRVPEPDRRPGVGWLVLFVSLVVGALAGGLGERLQEPVFRLMQVLGTS